MKTKTLISCAVMISCAVTAELIGVFVFSYAYCWFSYVVAQLDSSENVHYSCLGQFNILQKKTNAKIHY